MGPPFSSFWSRPIHLVREKNGKWRPCSDYRNLYNATIPDSYPIPHLQDFAQQFEVCSDFIKFRRITFGLRNAAHSFQRHMYAII